MQIEGQLMIGLVSSLQAYPEQPDTKLKIISAQTRRVKFCRAAVRGQGLLKTVPILFSNPQLEKGGRILLPDPTNGNPT